MMTNENAACITVEKAKFLAKQEAHPELKSFMHTKSEEVLESYYLETDYCWIFFKNPTIIVPDNALLGIKWAYAVSKKGNCRLVYDLRGEPEKMQKHLFDLSDYFKKNNE